MMEDYEKISQYLKDMVSTLNKKKAVLPEMEKRVKGLEQQYRELSKLRDLEGQVKSLKNQLAWAFVREKEQVWLF